MSTNTEGERVSTGGRPGAWPPRFSGSAEGLKAGVFAVGQTTGLFRVVRESRWRGSRLLILCYHGVSQLDEHEALRELYVPAELLRARMQALHDGDYRVLSLRDGLSRLAAGTLPARAVALTFDDGFIDFKRVAYPVLQAFGYPATVYVSTQYVVEQYPAFPPILAYVLWRGAGRATEGGGLTKDGLPITTTTAAERESSFRRLLRAANDMSDPAAASPAVRDARAAELAERLGVDYEQLKRSRLFHLMTVDELADLDRRLVDIQLHTHTHSQPAERSLLETELAENRRVLAGAGVPRAGLTHYCYPNGELRPELAGWLRSMQVESATTCRPGIASHDSDPLLLPRFVDTQDVSPLKFEAWLCGAAALLPQRT